MKWLMRFGAGLAPLGLLMKMLMDKVRTRVSPDASKLLEYLAMHTSAPVPELSSRLKLPMGDVSRLLAELERQGFVQLSGDQGTAHVRIAAITSAGRARRKA